MSEFEKLSQAPTGFSEFFQKLASTKVSMRWSIFRPVTKKQSSKCWSLKGKLKVPSSDNLEQTKLNASSAALGREDFYDGCQH